MKDFISDPIIEGSEATFELNLLGTDNNQTYMGKFKVKCLLSPMDIIESDKLYRTMLGENIAYAGETAKHMAFALSQLKYRIIEYPPFWENRPIKGSHISDKNIIIEILNVAIDVEELYRQKKIEEAKKVEERLTNAIKNKTLKKEDEDDKINVSDEMNMSQKDPDEIEIEEGSLKDE